MRDGIAKHGIRNALLTSIAPTGTISLFADNVSSGHRAGVQLRYSATCPDARRQPPREEVSDYAYPALPPPARRGCAAAGLLSSTPRACRPPTTW
jgi:hypothetical protein